MHARGSEWAREERASSSPKELRDPFTEEPFTKEVFLKPRGETRLGIGQADRERHCRWRERPMWRHGGDTGERSWCTHIAPRGTAGWGTRQDRVMPGL